MDLLTIASVVNWVRWVKASPLSQTLLLAYLVVNDESVGQWSVCFNRFRQLTAERNIPSFAASAAWAFVNIFLRLVSIVAPPDQTFREARVVTNAANRQRDSQIVQSGVLEDCVRCPECSSQQLRFHSIKRRRLCARAEIRFLPGVLHMTARTNAAFLRVQRQLWFLYLTATFAN